MLNAHIKKITTRVTPPASAEIVHKICGCKWSLTVFDLLAQGINRPGEMVRSVDGLTTKVLNDCLRRNVEFGLISKATYSEVPPRVEYNITQYGQRFMAVLYDLEQLGPPPT
ncbi:transcriptional regulator, HxlR family [Octadecabacter temperatus]|uniref:Putative HTH-type transcriptional regulator YtcD n=1 Tax=Octadecabacter temperatus TaxID=1458307 RepID=A0A0K0Y8K8_9RHOB|nr:helix-turn-helix domain-containing protein [Octadecabacter temperatus]AKS47304.1 putative HTH-type transcriptional regulator YtcD [Octadecabacter temperatus]SIO44214.1 transcriptional regulator, HxlR family [Octadecabacter temperatus]